MNTKDSFVSIVADDPDVSAIKFYVTDSILETTYISGMTLRTTLNSAESRILDLLVKQPGKVITRKELAEYAWCSRVVADGSLSQAIFNLRTSLHDTIHHNTIQTIPRRGYAFNEKYLYSVSQTTKKDNSIPNVGVSDEIIGVSHKSKTEFIKAVKTHTKKHKYFIFLFFVLVTVAGYIAHSLKYFIQNPLYHDEIIIGSTRLNLIDTKNPTNENKFKEALKQLQRTKINTPSEVWLSIDHSTYKTYCFVGGDEAAYGYMSVGIFSTHSAIYYCVLGASGK